jgi:hypothetical protein
MLHDGSACFSNLSSIFLSEQYILHHTFQFKMSVIRPGIWNYIQEQEQFKWSSWHCQSGTEAARGAEGAPAPPTACVIKEFFFSFP